MIPVVEMCQPFGPATH